MIPPKPILRFFSRIHAAVYRRSGGQRRNEVNGLPVLLLTTTGRQSGQAHTVPLVYLSHGTDYLIAPGMVPRPDWYLNLQHFPRAEIQIGSQTIAVEAEEVAGSTRTQLWKSVPEYWRNYEKRAGTLLPLVQLHPHG